MRFQLITLICTLFIASTLAAEFICQCDSAASLDTDICCEGKGTSRNHQCTIQSWGNLIDYIECCLGDGFGTSCYNL